MICLRTGSKVVAAQERLLSWLTANDYSRRDALRCETGRWGAEEMGEEQSLQHGWIQQGSTATCALKRSRKVREGQGSKMESESANYGKNRSRAR